MATNILDLKQIHTKKVKIQITAHLQAVLQYKTILLVSTSDTALTVISIIPFNWKASARMGGGGARPSKTVIIIQDQPAN